MIVFECPGCKTKLQVADQHAGMTIQCPTCKGHATAPKAAGTAAEAIAAAPAPAPPPAPEARTGVTEHAQAAPSDRRRDEDPQDDRPRRRDSGDATRAAAKGMGVGAILLIVFGVLGCVGLAVVAVLIALLVPAVQKVREAAARTQSVNNIKQITLAMQSFHDANKRLPFNGSDENPPGFGGAFRYSKNAIPGSPVSGSWAFQILPYLDQQAMYATANRNTPVFAYLCPGRGRPQMEVGGGAWSDYFYNNYLNDNQAADKPDRMDVKRTMVGITDGTSNTIFVGHGNISTQQYSQTQNVTLCTNIFNGGTFGTARAGNPAPNGDPRGVVLGRDRPGAPGLGTWGGPFPQGALMGLGDCTVRTFSYNMPNLGQFLTPTGNEPTTLPDF